MSVYLAHGPGGVSLPDLIATADAMNHAIPTSGELSRALTRLARCRVINQIDDRFFIAAEFLPGLAEANSRQGGLFQLPENGRNWLSSVDFELDEHAEIKVRQENVTAAFEHYRNALKRPK